MAKLADSEATIYRLSAQLRKRQQQYSDLQAVLAILALRESDGRLVITPQEMMTLPSGTVIVRSDQDDGCVVISTLPGKSIEELRSE